MPTQKSARERGSTVYCCRSKEKLDSEEVQKLQEGEIVEQAFDLFKQCGLI